MRVFVALDPAPDLVGALSALQDDLTVGRHVDEDDLHLTLAFVPDLAPRLLDDLLLDLEMLTVPALAISTAGLDLFGADKPRSLHALVAPDPALLGLQARVMTLLRRAGVDLPHRRFLPHITLARFSGRMAPDDQARLGRFLQRHGNWRFPPCPPVALTLYQSTLTSDGARYDVLGSMDLT